VGGGQPFGEGTLEDAEERAAGIDDDVAEQHLRRGLEDHEYAAKTVTPVVVDAEAVTVRGHVVVWREEEEEDW
jgi:hypothetical protein